MRTRGWNPAVECLPEMLETMDLIPSTIKKKKKNNQVILEVTGKYDDIL